MPTLHLHLREGFESERVVVRVNDRVAVDEPTVRTRMQVGLAAIHEVDVPDGPVAVEVALPGRRRTRTLMVDASRVPYLGVSVAPDGDVAFESTAEAFGYV